MMITVTLKLRCGKTPARRPDAWFIPGGDVSVWLREIAAWEVPHGDVRLLPVPRSSTDRQPCGVLALVEKGRAPVAARCVAFAKAGDRVFIPVDAWFDPDVSEAELRELCFSDSQLYVWHPAAGLVAFEPADVLRLSDLIEIEPPLARLWDGALPGVAFSRRLVSLMPEQSLSFEQMLQDGRDDIGSEQPDADNLPAGPREPQPGIGGAIGRQGMRMLANAAQWLAQHMPAGSGGGGGSGGPGWINNLEALARRKLVGIYAGLDAERNKEITRLLNLLQTDPDKGLRYALPMGGDAHRGIAPPSGRLGERNVDFKLGGLGGGQAADFWDLSAKHRQDLITRYRELANREINLGRHRRAAYIFAELLGDLHSAANALEAGRHWREAAVLYQQKLKRPMDAARCLEQGGQWAEAIALYQELKEHEKAGDLLVRLEQREAADAEYRLAAGNHHTRGDHLSAARLYENKLRAPDEAVDELASGWPASSQAGQCLRGVFAMLGKMGRHDAAQRWVARFREDGPPQRLRVQTVEILAETATGYPDRTTSLAAADCTRRLISGQLAESTPSNARQLLHSLGKLAPEDRLLTRDCQRFLGNVKPPNPAAPRKVDVIKRPRLIRAISLASGYKWRSATWSGDTIFVAGDDGRSVYVVRCAWDGAVDSPAAVWKLQRAIGSDRIILSISPQNDDLLLVHVVDHEWLGTQPFPVSDRFPHELRAGSVGGVTENTLGADRTTQGTTWRLESNHPSDHFVLTSVRREGQASPTYTVPYPDPETWENLGGFNSFSMHARSNKVYLGVLDQLTIVDEAGKMDQIPFADLITSLGGSAPNTRTRVALTFPHGAAIFWDDVEGRRTQHIAEDRVEPVAGFNRGGYLVVADASGCEIYGTSGRHAKLEGSLSGFAAKPIAVLSAPRTDQFGIAFENGQIHVYEMP